MKYEKPVVRDYGSIAEHTFDTPTWLNRSFNSTDSYNENCEHGS